MGAHQPDPKFPKGVQKIGQPMGAKHAGSSNTASAAHVAPNGTPIAEGAPVGTPVPTNAK